MVDKKLSTILIISGLFSLTSIIMSMYSIATPQWSILGKYSIGLFQSCTQSGCVKNQYEDTNFEAYSPPIYSKHLFNAGPLAIISVIFQLIGCILCFFTLFINFLPKPSITCYITPILIFLSFLFQLSTIAEASYGIKLNGKNSSIFEAALVFQVLTIILTFISANRIHKMTNVEYV